MKNGLMGMKQCGGSGVVDKERKVIEHKNSLNSAMFFINSYTSSEDDSI